MDDAGGDGGAENVGVWELCLGICAEDRGGLDIVRWALGDNARGRAMLGYIARPLFLLGGWRGGPFCSWEWIPDSRTSAAPVGFGSFGWRRGLSVRRPFRATVLFLCVEDTLRVDDGVLFQGAGWCRLLLEEGSGGS